MLTQAELKSYLHYSQETGIFTYIKSKGNSKKGSVAGSVTNKGYISIQINGKKYQAHRLAFLYITGEFPKNEVDHINCIKLDNRWLNLRNATHVDNVRNVGKRLNNTSGFKGVSFHKSSGLYQARCGFNGKSIYLGLFKTSELAYIAYQEFAKKNHGEFYRGSLGIKFDHQTTRFYEQISGASYD